MQQGTFAFFAEQELELEGGRSSTLSQGSAGCTGVASATGLTTTSTTTDGLWTWGDGVVMDPEKPEGEWAELHEWIRFDLRALLFYYRHDRQDFYKYEQRAIGVKGKKPNIGPGYYINTHMGPDGSPNIQLPKIIIEHIDTPLFISKQNQSAWSCLAHIALMKIYRNYDKNKLPVIDHMNGNPADNHPSNLRPVTGRQNKINSSKWSWRAPGIFYDKRKKRWLSNLDSKRLSFMEECDAIACRRILLQEAITKGDLEAHDLSAFDKRVEAAYAYRRANNIDAHGRKLDQPAILAPIDPAANLVTPAASTRSIRAYGSTLWYRP